MEQINRLQYLSELECSVDVSPIFYFNLAQLCRKLSIVESGYDRIDSKLIFDLGFDDNQGLLSLIELQNNLKDNKFHQFHVHTN